MAEVKVGFRPVFGHKHFTVLKRAHRARIHVDVRIKLDHRHLESARLQKCRQRSGGDAFTLPFSFSVLADYIATDRSAMMRELRHLKEQGIVCTDGRQIRLLGERPTA